MFVPLLALGVYNVGKLASGPRVGLLALVFALGSPLLIEQFHVYILDSPEAAIVALAVWLILASERFSRIRVAALAGVAVGLGFETKQQFPLFVLGLLVVVLVRGRGWRNWRGIAVFALAAAVVGSPWYLAHFGELARITHESVASATPGTLPNRLSLTNVEWYVWGALNTLLLAPLFAFTAIGLWRATAGLVRDIRARDRANAPAPDHEATATQPELELEPQPQPEPQRGGPHGIVPELLGGAFVSWLALTVTPIHVVRYMLPMIVYLAVLGTMWIGELRQPLQRIAITCLVVAVMASTLGATFGVGHRVSIALTHHLPADRSVFGVRAADQVVLYTTRNFLVSGPKRQGDMLALFKALARSGVTTVGWMPEQLEPYYYNHYGLDSLTAMARLNGLQSFNPNAMPQGAVLLLRQRSFGSTPPCLHLADGTGIWVRFGRALDPQTPSYCPFRHPAVYR